MYILVDCVCHISVLAPFFFFNDTATTEIYTLSLHDALPISRAFENAWGDTSSSPWRFGRRSVPGFRRGLFVRFARTLDRKSTRLNSSHANISYAVFCLKKKNRRPYICDSSKH